VRIPAAPRCWTPPYAQRLTDQSLSRAADELEEIARALFAIDTEGTGRDSEEPTHELARAVAYWMVTLRRLATSGPVAWVAVDERFSGAKGPTRLPEGPGEIVGQLDALHSFDDGVGVLGALAYAELVRRGIAPKWAPATSVPPMWQKFMEALDAAPDRMTGEARYLDVTLVAGRHRLGAHRDPRAWDIPSFTNWGEVRLARVSVDASRRAAALDELRQVNASLPMPWSVDDYDHLLDLLVAIAPRLDRDARRGIERAYRLAGFDSQPIADIVSHGIRLLRMHLDELERLVAAAGSNGDGQTSTRLP